MWGVDGDEMLVEMVVKVLLGFVVQRREIESRKMHSKIGFFFSLNST